MSDHGLSLLTQPIKFGIVWIGTYYITQRSDNRVILIHPISDLMSYGRFIMECEYINDKEMAFKIILNTATLYDDHIVIPARSIEGGYSIDEKYTFSSDWTDVCIVNTPPISNLSIFYDQDIDSNYVNKSFEALSTQYVPQLSEDWIEISDNLITNINLGNVPNSTLMQLDNLLIRGISHRRFTEISTEDLDSGDCLINLWLGTYDNTLFTTNQIIQDYKIGDVISIDGTSQELLNRLLENRKVIRKRCFFYDESTSR
jgi:hypothetical protein